MPKGTIKKLIRDRGFGFIRDEDGSELFFHRTAIVEGNFDQLREGQRVTYRKEKGPRGPRAVDVTPEATE
mgnify:CR=1 FL=1